jgi:hypothetical protein
MKKMRSESRRFSALGGFSPDGVPSPIVDNVNAANCRV